MSESEDKAELGGLARTIDALFADRPSQASTAPSTDEVASETASGIDGLDGTRESLSSATDFEGNDAPGDLSVMESDGAPGEGPGEEPEADPVPSLEEPAVLEPQLSEPQLDVGQVASSEVLWSESPELLDASAEALAAEVEAYVKGPGDEKPEHAAKIREIGEGMMGSSTFDPLVVAVQKLALAAGDPPSQDVIAVAETLLFPAVSSRIVALLGVEKDEARQAELRTVCVRIGPEMAVALSDSLAATTDRFMRHACVGTIVEMGEAAMPVVEKMIEDNRWFVVRNAVAVLGEVGGARAIELVMGTLANSDGRVRRGALQALAKLGGDDAGQLAYGMLEDPDSEVRLAAAVTCGELKVERALKLLVQMLEDEKKKPDFIVPVLRALGQLADPGAVNAIEKHAKPSFLSKPRSDVRIAAYRALNHIGTPHARRLLNQAADDKDPEIKRMVRGILGMG